MGSRPDVPGRCVQGRLLAGLAQNLPAAVICFLRWLYTEPENELDSELVPTAFVRWCRLALQVVFLKNPAGSTLTWPQVSAQENKAAGELLTLFY